MKHMKHTHFSVCIFFFYKATRYHDMEVENQLGSDSQKLDYFAVHDLLQKGHISLMVL